MQYTDLDWNRLWQDAKKQTSWKKKGKEEWDKRAAGFAKRNVDSDYADKFISLLQPEPHWRLLDVGAGPGTLALPLASHVKN